jgi:hypothetical protein
MDAVMRDTPLWARRFRYPKQVDRRKLPLKPLGGQLHAARRPGRYVGSFWRLGIPAD